MLKRSKREITITTIVETAKKVIPVKRSKRHLWLTHGTLDITDEKEKRG